MDAGIPTETLPRVRFDACQFIHSSTNLRISLGIRPRVAGHKHMVTAREPPRPADGMLSPEPGFPPPTDLTFPGRRSGPSRVHAAAFPEPRQYGCHNVEVARLAEALQCRTVE